MNANDLRLQYASQSIEYTTQFVASMSAEEVILDCGSMLVTGDGSSQKQLPIHTRMALPWSAVERLHRLLGEVIEARQSSPSKPAIPSASLPPLSIDTGSTRDQHSVPKPHWRDGHMTFESETS